MSDHNLNSDQPRAVEPDILAEGDRTGDSAQNSGNSSTNRLSDEVWDRQQKEPKVIEIPTDELLTGFKSGLAAPVNSLLQITDRVTPGELDARINVATPAEATSSGGGTVGYMLGSLPYFFGLDRGVAKVTGWRPGSLASLPTAGAIQGTLLTPVDEAGDFWQQRAQEGATQAGAGLFMGIGTRMAGKLPVFFSQRTGLGRSAHMIGTNAIGGATGGLAGAEIHGLVNGRQATGDELFAGALGGAAFGGGFGGLSAIANRNLRQMPTLRAGQNASTFKYESMEPNAPLVKLHDSTRDSIFQLAMKSANSNGDAGSKWSSSTGFLVNQQEGLIATAYHSVADADQVFLNINNRQAKARVVGTDKANDLALVKLDKPELVANKQELPIVDETYAVPVEKNNLTALGYGHYELPIDRYRYSVSPAHLIQKLPKEAAAIPSAVLDSNPLKLHGQALYGMSGGPILTPDGAVAGVTIWGSNVKGLQRNSDAVIIGAQPKHLRDLLNEQSAQK